MTELEELREEVKNAHAALKDLRHEIRNAEAARKAISEAIPQLVGQLIREETDRQLGVLGNATKNAMKESVDRVMTEFDRLTNLVMYGKMTSKAPKDVPSISNLIEKAYRP